MKFSVISCKISSLWVLLWALLGSLVSFIIVLLESGARYPFYSLPSKSGIELFFGGEWFSSILLLPITSLGVLLLCS
jgi:hypothetical protein